MKRLNFLLFILLLGCSDIYSQKVTLDTESGTVDLGEQLSGDWENVCILMPYTTSIRASDILGFPYIVEQYANIAHSDGISLLVTIKNEEVVGSYEISQKNVDFTQLALPCYLKEQAKFSVPKGDWPKARHQMDTLDK